MLCKDLLEQGCQLCLQYLNERFFSLQKLMGMCEDGQGWLKEH